MATEISSVGKNAILRKLFENSGYRNDAGAVFSGGGDFVSVNRIFLERVDFDLVYNPLKHLGRKLAMNVTGELYARMSGLKALNAVLGFSNRFSYEDVRDLWEGILSVVREHSASSVSLDLIPSASGLVVGLSAYGERDRRLSSSMPEPKSKDLIVLSGDLGAAYMGFHVLEREKAAFSGSKGTVAPKQPDLSGYRYVVGEYLSPELAPGIPSEFEKAGVIPSRGYFMTHGLGEAVKRISSDTGLGVKVYIERLPIASKTMETARELNIDPITAVVNGGDDYRLLYVVPIAFHEILRRDFQNWDIIGHLARPEAGEVLVTPEGAEIGIHAQGYE